MLDRIRHGKSPFDGETPFDDPVCVDAWQQARLETLLGQVMGAVLFCQGRSAGVLECVNCVQFVAGCSGPAPAGINGEGHRTLSQSSGPAGQ